VNGSPGVSPFHVQSGGTSGAGRACEAVFDSFGEVLERTIQAFERRASLSVCIHDIGKRLTANGEPLLTRARRMHGTVFCSAVKTKRQRACIRSDNADLIPLCERHRDVFLHVCHAHACEIVAPVYHYDELLCVIFAGQFRSEDSHPAVLPLLSGAAYEDCVGLVRMLRSYVADAVRAAARRGQAEGTSRAQRIARFLDATLQSNPSVDALARHLGLSPSRTSHLVKEETGHTFRALKEARRLAIAKRLLTETASKIAFVASKAGCDDANYFCRFFKTRTGLTPSQFRRRYGQTDSV